MFFNRENSKETPSKEEEMEAQEEEDDLDALISPISAITKVGSGGTRGLSAASTVLPGTSIVSVKLDISFHASLFNIH